MKKVIYISISIIIFIIIFLTCHPLTNPLDPESENYIGISKNPNPQDGISIIDTTPFFEWEGSENAVG